MRMMPPATTSLLLLSTTQHEVMCVQQGTGGQLQPERTDLLTAPQPNRRPLSILSAPAPSPTSCHRLPILSLERQLLARLLQHRQPALEQHLQA